MPRGRQPGGSSRLESRIQQFAIRFAHDVIAALASAPLSDIARISGNGAGLATIKVSAGAPAVGPGRRAKRKMANYPKCHWPGCFKNMSPRTRPWCGEHNRKAKEEGIPAGAGPKNAGESTAAARKPRARKAAKGAKSARRKPARTSRG